MSTPDKSPQDDFRNIVYPRGPWFRFTQAHLQWLQAHAQERGFAGPTRVLAQILDRAIAELEVMR